MIISGLKLIENCDEFQCYEEVRQQKLGNGHLAFDVMKHRALNLILTPREFK